MKNIFKRLKKYNILVLGCNGMLGHDVYARLQSMSIMQESNIGTVIGLDKTDVNLIERHALGNFFMGSIHFDYCINCVAYTDTKAAETTKAGRELDYKLNALVPKYIAESCKYWKTKLIHISTDYVFSEMSDDAAWNPNNSPILLRPDYEPFPSNVYGYDKLLGEMNIKEIFGKDSKNYCILRTSWLYGMHNNKSFVHKFIANLVKAAKEGKTEVEMTSNEYSVPTSCKYVTNCIINVINDKISGIYHAVPNCKDSTKDHVGISRLEFADHILQFLIKGKYNTSEKDYIDFSKIKLVGVNRDSYWPTYSAMLSSAEWASISWDESLDNFLFSNVEKILGWANAQIHI